MTEDDIRLAEDMRKSGEARQILKNPAFKDAVAKVNDALLSGMRSSAIRDSRLRLRLLDKYEALHALLDELQSTVNTGLMAEKEIEQKTLAQRVKEALRFS